MPPRRNLFLLSSLLLFLLFLLPACASPAPAAITPAAPTAAAPAGESLEAQARQALAGGDFTTAAVFLKRLTATQPENAWAHYQAGLITYAQDPAAALPLLQRGARLDPDYLPAVNSLALALEALPAGSDPAAELLLAGRALADLGEWPLAEAAFTRASAAAPGYAEAWAYLGEARQHLDGAVPQSGLSELRKAVALDPNSLAARSLFSLYWQRHGQPERAIEHQQAAVALDPANPSLLAGLAALQAATGDLAGAELNYTRAIELAPADPAYLRLLAGFALDYDYLVEEIALPAAQEALGLSPKDPVYLDLLAHTLLQLGRLEAAATNLAQALAEDPYYAPAQLHQGMLHLLRGNQQAARLCFESARRLDPNGPAAAQAERLLQLSAEE